MAEIFSNTYSLNSSQPGLPPSDPVPKKMLPNPFAPIYKGLATSSFGNPSLTSHSTLADRSKLTDVTHGGLHTVMSPRKGEETSEHSVSAKDKRKFSASDETSRNASYHTALYESPLSSEAEIHPSSGVRLDGLDESDLATPHAGSNQVKTFQQLAGERGIREWNHRVLDERWLEAAEPSVKGTEEEHSSVKDDSLPAGNPALDILRHPRLQSFLKELDYTREKMVSQSVSYRPDPSIWGRENTDPQYSAASGEQRATKE